ncbi:MAG: HXXEE domain-containing protein [Terracidiphilus sp.]|jgi:hypothetical protein
MTLDTYSALLILTSIIVFAVHNAEETLGIEDWMAKNFRPSIAVRYRKKSFIVACTLLWVAYAVMALLAVWCTSATVLHVFGIAFAAIVANGFFHVLAWIYFGKIPPGFWSTAILVLPLGGLLTWHAIAMGTLTFQQAEVAFVIGAVLQMPLACGAIFISDFLFGLKERIFQK